jgi:hypothetical protein
MKFCSPNQWPQRIHGDLREPDDARIPNAQDDGDEQKPPSLTHTFLQVNDSNTQTNLHWFFYSVKQMIDNNQADDCLTAWPRYLRRPASEMDCMDFPDPWSGGRMNKSYAELNRYFLIPSLRILVSSVDRGIPSLAAAPEGPAMRPWLSTKADSINSLSLSAPMRAKPLPE